MDKEKNKSKQPQKKRYTTVRSFLLGIGVGICAVACGAAVYVFRFESRYRNTIYPHVYIGSVAFGGKTEDEAKQIWLRENTPFENAFFTFSYGEYVATVSGMELHLGYDATLSARQAYLIGRSGNILSDLFTRYLKNRTTLHPLFRWDTTTLEDTLAFLAQYIDVPPQEALFKFENGKVTAFKPSINGARLNREHAIAEFVRSLPQIREQNFRQVHIPLVADVVEPERKTENVNDLGIRDHIGRGYSEFAGSIQGRIHNVALSAATLNGIVIAPGQTLSFNEVVGDISQATGYRSAYIIKDGRTVLGDGGGVCQTSTTLFRAALDAGLPILERHPHAYRVKYYEQGGYKAGLDATVFAPSVDLVIQNTTPAHILIQSKTDLTALSLTIDFYGTSDGRVAEITNHKVWGETPPPPPVYQDDPTLPEGETRQVDWAAWGAKASFDYRVTRNGEEIINETFYSTFRPWQAIYLKGVKTD